MDAVAKFEKNRLALLRLVCFWLAVARLVRCTRVVLPSRIACFVGALLFKMEAAAGLLLLCKLKREEIADHRLLQAAQLYAAGLPVPEAYGPMTLDAIIDRLRALRSALRGLRGGGGRSVLQRGGLSVLEGATQSATGGLQFGTFKLRVPP